MCCRHGQLAQGAVNKKAGGHKEHHQRNALADPQPGVVRPLLGGNAGGGAVAVVSVQRGGGLLCCADRAVIALAALVSAAVGAVTVHCFAPIRLGC